MVCNNVGSGNLLFSAAQSTPESERVTEYKRLSICFTTNKTLMEIDSNADRGADSENNSKLTGNVTVANLAF